MKRVIACVLLALLLAGCAGQQPPIREPEQFYYRRTQVIYDRKDGVVAPEERETYGINGSLADVLNLYVQGPESETLVNVFPPNSEVLTISVEKSQAWVQMNSVFARLRGMELTMACACLTKTIHGLTGAQTVYISAHERMLGDAEQIVMNADAIIFEDVDATDPGSDANS